ncbi:hypothetical protein FB45DRAFT_896440 [Roridomyces roridus]|uniref:Uncharacterized protein n=1 Tax=Roridomyces roridus TaxID=1738132 RepID=A0AAD7FXQ8_9AGAR|nr:hypothetical protein FB45DRAFT_896440 [Roridomyces roridus]
MAGTSDFDSAWEQVVPYLIKTTVALFLNAVYDVLVVLALYFVRRRDPAGKRILICAIIVMFIFALVEMALQIVTVAYAMQALYSAVHSQYEGALDTLKTMSNILGFVEEFLLIMNNAIADAFFMYRCYVVWGYNRKVVVLPAVISVITIGVGYATLVRDHFSPPQYFIDTRIVFGLVMFNNLFLTCLTAGPIWRSRRNLQVVGQTKFIYRYNIAMAMLLESATIYFICITIGIIIVSLGGFAVSLVPQTVYGIFSQLMNIVPTLVIVQVSLGRQIDRETSSVGSMEKMESV